MMSLPEQAGDPRANDYITEIAALKTQFDVFRFLKRLTEAFGCRAFMVMNLPPVTSADLNSHSVITNWPAELLTIYDQEGLLPTSPVLKRLRSSTLPFVFDIEERQSERGSHGEPIMALFERFNMPRFGYFPTHDSSGLRGAVSFAGDREAFTDAEMRELSFLSIHVFNRLAEIRDMDTRVGDTLSEREVDCLNWTAAGKTSVEIAEILGLSEHTINHYLNRATKKLNTVNRTHAVAKALRVGFIR